MKTSGSKGFHIVVPLDGKAGFGEVSRFAHAVGAVLVKRDPEHLTQEFSKADRGGRILVDTGRNGYSATFAAAYAVRAKPGAPVSAPCTWEEIERGEVGPQTFTLRTMAGRIAEVGDLWSDMRGRGRSLRHADGAAATNAGRLSQPDPLGVPMERELKLRIVIEGPPPGVEFGLQKGQGSHYETVQKQRSETRDLCFEFTVRVKGERKDPNPTFLGSFVQGPPGERFVYIDIGTLAGQTDSCWSRRLKVPLRGISWDMLDRVSPDSQAVLETRVPGTGRDGGPSCATVKPFAGWKLRRAPESL